MKRLLNVIIATALLTGCEPSTQKNNDKAAPENLQENTIATDTTPRVTGIGGIFFSAEEPEKTKQWYEQNLGMTTDDYGAVFEFKNASRPNEINYLRWGLFDNNTDYFQPSKKHFMINYRVQNLEGLVRQLQNNGVQLLDTIAMYDYGKFVHLQDTEGNKIELWEPVDSILTKLGGKTNK